MKKCLALLLLIISLTGCIPAALVVGATGAAVGSTVIYDKRSYKQIKTDHKARAIAQHKINTDSALAKNHSHVSVAIFNGVALLVGQVKTMELREQGYKIVAKVPNIKRICNEITVMKPISTMEKAHDDWITTKVKLATIAKPGLRSSNLKVVTENGVVYLMGLVSKEQADLATEASRRVKGVIKVVKVFEYE